MNYPLISEYIEAIKSAEDNFEELSSLRPVLGKDGQPVMTSGNFAVVFKMKDERDGKFYAVKCFTKEQVGRANRYDLISNYLDMSTRYLVHVHYYEKELFVDSNVTSDELFPVLLMDWVDGVPLDTYIRNNLSCDSVLQNLTYSFSKFAVWLKSQSFAHGDLKPDNILVNNNCELVLVDYDGMFVPAMKGLCALEMGSPNFRHPLRSEKDFNENMDDFSIVSILLSLKLISLNPQLYDKYATQDRLLFSDSDYRNIMGCELIKGIASTVDDDCTKLIGLLLLAYAEKNLSMIEPYFLRLSVPDIYEYTKGFCEPFDDLYEDMLLSCWKDNQGGLYSCDRTKLLKGANVKEYNIRDGVQEIAPCSFSYIRDEWTEYSTTLKVQMGDYPNPGYNQLEEVHVPNSLESIGYYAFYRSNLKALNMPSSIKTIGEYAFAYCSRLENIVISDSIVEIRDYTFFLCNSLNTVKIPQSVKRIGKYAFGNCKGLETLILPYALRKISKNAFEGCVSLKDIYVPKGRKNWYSLFLPSELRQKVKEMNL